MVDLKSVLKEARRRRVFRTAGIYIVASWVAVQVFSEIFPALDIPASAIRYIWLGALIGLPIAIVFGWLYDVTTAGIVRTAPANIGADVDLGLRKADYAILAALAVAASTVVVQLGGRVSNQGTMADVPATEATVLPSIGVLPLENLSADPGQEYFANGLHDALIADLSRISGLRVTSKMSARAYANTTKPIETVCSELAISKVITGNLLRVEDNLTVNVELKDCDDDELLWSSAYSRKLSDVLIIQSEITRSVADAVEVALTRQETELLARTRTVNPAAYESYLRGMFHLEMITPKDMQLAEDLFTRALEFDRNSALAHWGLGRACRFQMQFGMGMPQERDPECRGHQFRALAIDPELPQVHLGLALSYWLYDYDWEAADTSFRRALELNPNYAEAYMFYSHFLVQQLRWEESERNILRAIELDPLNPFVLGLRGAQLHLSKRDEEAVETISRIHREVPGFGFGFDVLWRANFRLGNLDAALQAARNFYAVTMGMPEVVETIAQVYAEHGYERAMRELGENLEALAAERYVQALFVAAPFGMIGDADKATSWLEKGFLQHDPQMPYLGCQGGWYLVADNPRFVKILEKMNLSSYRDYEKS